ncbi:MAG: GNAT family N-acetyltransferase [Acidobacteria bacterium]|nr:GNAT family N-acetyltransferase [Acidobacteriota bacterium]
MGRSTGFWREPRTIIPLDDRFHVRRSLRKFTGKSGYQISFDTDFPAVIRACARHDEVDDEEVWLSEEMINLYIELFSRGFAHSVEVSQDGMLVGGLYGHRFKRRSFWESMFSRAT